LTLPLGVYPPSIIILRRFGAAKSVRALGIIAQEESYYYTYIAVPFLTVL